MARSFEDIYQIAPLPAVRRLTGFREAHPARTMEKNGLIWRVWDLGQGERALVFIPSGMGHGEVFFPYMQDLCVDMRCIAVSLPACRTMEEYARRLHALLTEELGVKQAILVACGIGGLISQTYLRLYRDEVPAQVLITCGAPCRELPDEDCQRWTVRRKLVLRYTIAPFEPMRQQMGYQTFDTMCPEELQEGMQFWRAFISETYEHYVYKKQFVLLNCRALPDIYEKKPFFAGDMAGWTGKTLIMESEGDHYYKERERALLKDLYPGAQVEDIGPLGQFALMAREKENIALIRDFLRSL